MPRPAAFRDLVLLFLLGLAWGSSFLFIEIALDTVPPATIAAGRLLFGATLLYLLLRLSGDRLPRELRAWRGYVLIGLLGNAVPFTLIGIGQQEIESGLAAVLMAVMPLFTLALAHFLVPGERVDGWRLVGVLLGFGGILVLVGPHALGGIGSALLAQLVVLAGALSYGLTNIIAARIPRRPPLVSGTATMICATAWTIPISLVLEAPWTVVPDGAAVLSILTMGLFSTAAAAFIYFRLIASAGASFTAQVNFIVPVTGVFWGWLFLDEALSPEAFVALALILLGIALSRHGRRGAAPAQSPSTSAIE